MAEAFEDFLGIGAQLKQNVVVAANGQFEEHPEAYHPRVFVKTEHGSAKTYELLQDGQAIIWPKPPNRETCGFPFWLVNADDVTKMTMMRRTL